MKAILVLCTILIAFCGKSVAVKFPQEVPKCKKGDSACIVKSANAMIKNFAGDGNRNINLSPLDPFLVPRIYIKQGDESPVNVVLVFTNNSVIGLKDSVFTDIKGFDENIEGKYELHYIAPSVQLVGPYSINGRILILPIQGDGISNITISNPNFVVRFDGKKIERNGKFYLKPEHTKLKFTTTKAFIKLDNLYNGDKLLGDSTNSFLNENWKDVFPEIQQSVFDAFGQIVENILTNVFAKVPYDELFAKDN